MCIFAFEDQSHNSSMKMKLIAFFAVALLSCAPALAQLSDVTVMRGVIEGPAMLDYMDSLAAKQKAIDFSKAISGNKMVWDAFLSWRQASGVQDVINGIMKNDIFHHSSDTLYLIEQVSDYNFVACSYVWSRHLCYAISYVDYSKIQCVPYKRHVLDTVRYNNQDPEYLLEKYLEIDPIEMTMDLVEQWNRDSILHHSSHGYEENLKVYFCSSEIFVVSKVIVKDVTKVEIETIPICAIDWHPEIDDQWIMRMNDKALENYRKRP